MGDDKCKTGVGQAGRELASALLEGLLKVGEGAEDAAEQKTFPFLVVGCIQLFLSLSNAQVS